MRGTGYVSRSLTSSRAKDHSHTKVAGTFVTDNHATYEVTSRRARTPRIIDFRSLLQTRNRDRERHSVHHALPLKLHPNAIDGFAREENVELDLLLAGRRIDYVDRVRVD